MLDASVVDVGIMPKMSAVAAPPSSAPELKPEAARELFDQQARLYLGIGREEFLARLETGELAGSDEPRVGHLMLLLPFAR